MMKHEKQEEAREEEEDSKISKHTRKPNRQSSITKEKVLILLTVYICTTDTLNNLTSSGPIQINDDTIYGLELCQQTPSPRLAATDEIQPEGLLDLGCRPGRRVVDCSLRPHQQQHDYAHCHSAQSTTTTTTTPINDKLSPFNKPASYAHNGHQDNQAVDILKHKSLYKSDDDDNNKIDYTRGGRIAQDPPRTRPWRWSIIGQAQAIRLVRIEVPLVAQAGQTVKLRCLVDAKGDKLHSLSWYKNGREFYRYQPSERRQPVLAFNTTGIQLDMSRSRNNTITLVNTTTETSGRYKCEATGASFQEAHLESYLNITPPAMPSSAETIILSLGILSLCCMISLINLVIR